jgi:hypothetical protein
MLFSTSKSQMMGKESSRSRSRTNDLERRKKKSFPFQPANEGGLTE